MAVSLISTGFTAGSGYGEVWIRDFNTFIIPACLVQPKDSVNSKLRVFFQMQGDDGNIIDGYIARSSAGEGYDYIYNDNVPRFAGHKNTVETDQESSLVQAVYKYVACTKDTQFLYTNIHGKTVKERMADAITYVLKHRYSSKYNLVYGAVTADWGDVQPEHAWGVVMDSSSHLAIDVYDNAMLLIAINNYLQLFPEEKGWKTLKDKLAQNVRKYLWDPTQQKFIPHLYLRSSPFPETFDEKAIYYHGGTATAIEAGLLSPKEVGIANQKMMDDVRASGAPSIGLSLYPVYPEGYFKNAGMDPYHYQNGGDWTWFGARMITQLVKHGYAQEAYEELQPMVDRVIANNDFYEWYTRDGKPAGSGNFRGSAGVLYDAITALQQWAEQHR